MTSPIDDECTRLLGWVGLGDKKCLTSASDWCQFMRAVSRGGLAPPLLEVLDQPVYHFTKIAKQDFEANMPSMAALDRYKRKDEYILHIAYLAPLVLIHNCLVFKHMVG